MRATKATEKKRGSDEDDLEKWWKERVRRENIEKTTKKQNKNIVLAKLL